MATVETDQGVFEVCTCGNAEGHAGTVWHPGVKHSSGAKLVGKQDLTAFEAAYQQAEKAHAAFRRALSKAPPPATPAPVPAAPESPAQGQ